MFFRNVSSLFILCTFLISFSTFGLEVDEKLTLRILRVSSTLKTILINRGIEDGLVVGDHARFFVPEGVIARGVSIKVSPTRSVWSIYRQVIPDYIREEEVLSLKITQPVKISDDPTRQVWKGERKTSIASSRSQGRMRDAGQDTQDFDSSSSLGDETGEDSTADADAFLGEDPELRELFSKKEKLLNSKFEFFGAVNFSNQASTTSSDIQGAGEFSGTSQNISLTLAGEYYFQDKTAWYSSVSLAPFLQFDIQQVFGARGSQVGTKFTDFGLMINVHPFKAKPWHIGKFIPFFSFSYAITSGSDSFNPGAEVAATAGTDGTVPGSFTGSGSGNVINFGAGIKTYLTNRWGMRAHVSLETRSANFSDDITNSTWTRSTSGLKITTSIGYRF